MGGGKGKKEEGLGGGRRKVRGREDGSDRSGEGEKEKENGGEDRA